MNKGKCCDSEWIFKRNQGSRSQHCQAVSITRGLIRGHSQMSKSCPQGQKATTLQKASVTTGAGTRLLFRNEMPKCRIKGTTSLAPRCPQWLKPTKKWSGRDLGKGLPSHLRNKMVIKDICLMECGYCSPWVNHDCTLSSPLKKGICPLKRANIVERAEHAEL